ncbi:flagellar hook-length control protein FliK [Eubacterium sp. MSJ-21]|nr:flagellar hook-length control protein FliK [Eubacterium sp. MSJ-21]
MIVGIQSSGIGKIDITQTGGITDKSKSKDKASGTFADLMNLAVTKPDTTAQTADSEMTKNDVDAVKQADTTVSGEKKKTNLNKYEKTDAKTETTHTDAEKTKQNEAAQETESDDIKVKLLSGKLKKLLNVDDETLQNLLQTAGLMMKDLLDPAVMKDFILQINDATSVDLLINESLDTLMQQAMQLLDEIPDTTDMTVVSSENPVEKLFPEETKSVQPEEQESVMDAEKPQMVEAKTEILSQAEPEKQEIKMASTVIKEQTGQKNVDNTEVQMIETEVQVTVQTEDAGDSDASADLMKQNAENVISNLNQAMSQITGDEIATTPFDTSVTQTDIVRQVVDEIRLNLSKDVTSMTLQLNPEQLGKVQIHVSTKNGVMQAQIIAENEAAKAAVESGLTVLKEAFENQDLKVEAIEVMVGTPDYFTEESDAQAQMEQKEQKSGKSAGSVNFSSGSDDEINEDMSLKSEMMKAQGNQVNYMA